MKEYVKGCAKCQESKTNIYQVKAPLQHFDMAVNQGPFQYISMDLITDLPKSDGFDLILLTIVDQGCSKAAKFILCHKTINGTGVANKYLKHLVPWNPPSNHFRSRSLLCIPFLQVIVHQLRDPTEFVHGLSSKNR